MSWRTNLVGLLVLSAVLFSVTASAAVKLPSIIGDNMVLQRDRAVPVWGWDDAGTKVTVILGEAKATATADANGRWAVELPAMKAGGPHTMTIEGTDTVTLKNILVGEVWVCSGQSNMEWTVQSSDNPQQEIAAANHPMIRHIKIPHVPMDTPQDNVPSDGWRVCSPETVAGFTAVGYYFGRHLNKELDVPIGLIGSNWGGTRIEPWTPPVGFQSVPALKDIADNLANFPTKNAEGKVNHQTPLALYNGMIHPLLPFAIRGAIWYQGESNNGEGMLYYEKKKALINGWRSVWNDPNMPFYFVQLAPYRYGGEPTRLAGIWEAQLKSLDIPHTGMAVTVDIGNVTDIHPRNKQDVGKRLALWALAKTYGQTGLVYSGPLYKSLKIDGNKAVVSFDHVGGGLVSRDGQPLTHFQIAGDNGEFVAAQAEIVGDTVVVSAESIAQPAAVRFAWHQEAEPNLSNKDGLPASPFRTDSW
jgi:sialate O-acetylesterase